MKLERVTIPENVSDKNLSTKLHQRPSLAMHIITNSRKKNYVKFHCTGRRKAALDRRHKVMRFLSKLIRFVTITLFRKFALYKDHRRYCNDSLDLWISRLIHCCCVTGYKMYFTLTRHTFGHLQSQLFPVYFSVGSCLSTVALVTYCLLHPIQLCHGAEKYQVNYHNSCKITH